MSKQNLDSIGPVSVGCTVRVTRADRPTGIEGTVTRLRRCDGGVMMTFKSAGDQEEHTQYIVVAFIGPMLCNHWVGYEIKVLKQAPHQQSFAGIKPAPTQVTRGLL